MNVLEDVNRAKQNGVRGFIVKPYSKQKILDCIQRFQQERELRRKAKQREGLAEPGKVYLV
jgi:FixJ family two-component response regulator